MREWKQEKYKMPKTHEQVCKRKRLFMRLLGITLDEKWRVMCESAVNHCDRLTARIAKKARRCAGLLLLFSLLIFAGCTASVGGGASVSAYYPEEWESPASRRQHTQPTLGMAQNNLPMVGGVK